MLPSNAKAILAQLEEELIRLYPDHAEDFARNKAAGIVRIDAMDVEIKTILKAHRDVPMLAFHDAYIYFETQYGLNMVSTVMTHHDAAAGVNRVRFLRKLIKEKGVKCVFHEPQFNSKILDVIDQDKEVSRAELDPIGVDVATGADLYPAMMLNLARAVDSCLTS